MIRTDSKALYTGITTDLKRRFAQHKQGIGAKYFRIHAPIKIVYVEACASKSEALKRERLIKRRSASQKRAMCKKFIGA